MLIMQSCSHLAQVGIGPALLLYNLVQVQGEEDIALVPRLPLGEVGLLILQALLYLGGQELFHEAPPGLCDAEVQLTQALGRD